MFHKCRLLLSESRLLLFIESDIRSCFNSHLPPIIHHSLFICILHTSLIKTEIGLTIFFAYRSFLKIKQKSGKLREAKRRIYKIVVYYKASVTLIINSELMGNIYIYTHTHTSYTCCTYVFYVYRY